MFKIFKLIGWKVNLGLLIGLLIAFASVYYIGYTKGENLSKIAISQYETKVQKLNADLANAQGKVDIQIITKYKDRVIYIDRVEYKTRTIVEQAIPEQYYLSKGWVYAYNQSILGLDPDPMLASDDSPSGITDKQALVETIIPNNFKSHQNAATLEGLQNWVIESEKARKEVTNEK
jgi:hypothetical protein